MPQAMTLPIIGVLAVAGVGAGIQLGHSALAEINPIYYSKPATRFHSDLVPNPPSGSAPVMELTRIETAAALGTGCVGCRAYPEEYFPIHDDSVDAEPAVYAMDGDKVRVAAVREEVDPDAARLMEEIKRVERYARGTEAAETAPASTAILASTDTGGEEEVVTH